MVLEKRPRGILAFFEELEFFPYDADHWKTNMPSRRRKNQPYGSSKAITEKISETTATTKMKISDVLAHHPTPVVVCFAFQENQQHSSRLRRKLVQLCGRHSIVCIALSPTTSHCDQQTLDFLDATGFHYHLQTRVLNTVLGITHVPCLVVVSIATGQKISSWPEELALEWNDDETVVRRWTSGQSGLSCTQKIVAASLFPSCTIL